MNIGVCGTGTVASWISDTICQMADENIVLYTCATSPGYDCKDFAEKFGYTKISQTYDELMQDPNVDLVYIAVPNNFHYDLCMKALLYGKNLVCEKPFSMSEKECSEILDLAKEKGLFVSEALWSLFLPVYRMIKEEIAAGTIGELEKASIIMMDNIMFLDRVKTLELGGGVLLDEGPYALGCMVAFFGTEVDVVKSETRKLDSGVDAEQKIHITYKSGQNVFIHLAMDTPEDEKEQYVEIVGSRGKIRMNAVANPSKVDIMDLDGNLIKELHIPIQIVHRGMPPVSGYEYEWLGFEKALSENRKECEEISNSSTHCISEIMTKVLGNADIEF